MLMEGGLPNFFTINGKAYPAIPHHTEHNSVEVEGGGGLTMIIDVAE
jgi:hypothetical protein